MAYINRSRPKEGGSWMFSNVIGTPPIVNGNNHISCGKCNCGWLLRLAAYFCQSPLIKGRVYFNINERRELASSVLLVQSGTLLVSVN